MSRWRTSISAVLSLCGGSLAAIGCSGVGLLADWQVVDRWSGRDTTAVRAFEVETGAWRLTYTMDAIGPMPGSLRLEVTEEGGAVRSVTTSAGNTASGTIFGTGPGRYRLLITANQAEWSVTLATPPTAS